MLFKKTNKKNSPIIHNQESGIAEWMENDAEIEGQLAIDVYQTDKTIVIKSTIAGVKPEDLKISLHNDLLVIKGNRNTENNIPEEDYLYKECYWGSFSRSIILPAEVDNKRVDAEIKNGVLTIILYKNTSEKIKVKFKD